MGQSLTLSGGKDTYENTLNNERHSALSLTFPVHKVGVIHQAKSVCEPSKRVTEKWPRNPRPPSNKDITLPSSPLSGKRRNLLFL